MRQYIISGKFPAILLGLLVLLGLYLTSLYSYLLFHSLVELFSIVIACGIFMVAWNSRRFLDNNYLLYIGIAYLFIGCLDLIHTLAYAGMGVFQGYTSNLPTQLWIASRYVESISLLIAFAFLGRKLRSNLMFLSYTVVISLLLVSIFWNIFPQSYIEGVGLTPFKKISEYIISLILVASVVMLFRNRTQFDRGIFRLLIASIAFTIGSELAFTFYISVYGFSNLIGHFFKLISFYLIYKAIIETGIRNPFDLLFRNLKQSEKMLQIAKDELEVRVEERIKELQCVYDIDKIGANPGLTIDEMCQEVVKILPRSWQYPEITCAKITIDSKEFKTKNYEDSKWMQSSDIKIYRAKAGEVTVIYLEERPKLDEGPFLKEERQLIDSVAEQLARNIETKQAQKALAESEDKYRAIFNEARDGIVLIDYETGSIVDCNREFENQTGRKLKQLQRMKTWEIRPPEKIEVAKRRFLEIKRGRRRLGGSVDLEFQKPNGAIVNIEFVSKKINIGDKEFVQSISRDITERKKMQEQLIITDRLASIGELASGIAHELNNPLTSVIGFSDLLLDKDVPDDVKEDLDVINREAKRTARVVKGLLTFARKQADEKQSVDINKDIQAVLDLRAYEQKISNIEVDAHFATNLPEIIANGPQLQQVFINIIINAEHFMTESHGRGTLTITTEQVGDIIRASFADDGPGIAKDTLGHLFDPFFTTKEVGKGTGLGLSISYGIITSHGGRIYAESELGKGATFVVELPVSK